LQQSEIFQSAAEIVGRPERHFHPAINADAWEAAKDEQGHPITDDRKARLGEPRHLISTCGVVPHGTLQARVHARAAQIGRTKPAPLILPEATIGHRILP
jgi:hypothetical protein